jgi:hypothetical protein
LARNDGGPATPGQNASVEAMAQSIARHLAEIGHPFAEQFVAWVAGGGLRPLSSAERRGNRDATFRALAAGHKSGHQATAAINEGLRDYERNGPWQHDREYGLNPKYIGTERERFFALMMLDVAHGERTIRRAVTGTVGHKRGGDGPKVRTQRGR